MKDISLIEEIAAEIHISSKEKAKEFADRMIRVKDFGSKFKKCYTKKIKPSKKEVIRVVGVTHNRQSISGFGGILFGISGIGFGMTYNNSKISDTWNISRFEVGDIDFFEYSQRLRWKEYSITYQILADIIDKNESIDIILTDMPLVISRKEQINKEFDRKIKREWDILVNISNNFWKQNIDRIFPFNSNGPFLVSLRRRTNLSLFKALEKKGIETSLDNIPYDCENFVLNNLSIIFESGHSRILRWILGEKERTVTYSISDLELDPRWEPSALKSKDLLGFFLRAKPNTDIWSVELPGGRDFWTVESVDKLCSNILVLSIFNDDKSYPLPLWYSQKFSNFPKEILYYYKKMIIEELAKYNSNLKENELNEQRI